MDQGNVLGSGQHRGPGEVKGHAFKLKPEAYLCVFFDDLKLHGCKHHLQQDRFH